MISGWNLGSCGANKVPASLTGPEWYSRYQARPASSLDSLRANLNGRKCVMTITIGRSATTGKTVTLPIDLVTQAIAVLGRRGSGKTNTATKIVEGLLKAKQQVVIIDPIGVWWGLKSNKSGKRAGHSIVVFGGVNGDLPINETDGKIIADLVVDQNLSCILSLDTFESNAAERRFITAFAERLYQRKKERSNRTPVMVVLEECHLVAPQKVQQDSTKMLASMTRLVRQGRNFGIGVMLIDQRSASVNKELLSQVELLIAHQTTDIRDRKAIQDWVNTNFSKAESDEFSKSLPKLTTPKGETPRSEAWLSSPSWLERFERVFIDERSTFDSSATPKVGAAVIAPERMAPVDLESLKSKLSNTIEKAKENDPATLKKRIRQLELEAKKKQQSAPIDQTAIDQAVNRAVLDRDKHWKGEVAKVERERKSAIGLLSQINRISVYEGNGVLVVEPSSPPKPVLAEIIPRRSITARAATATAHDSDTTLPKGERAILAAVINYPNGLRRDQITVITAYKRSTRDAYIKRLNEKGCVETDDSLIVATQFGIDALPDVGPLPSGAELQEFHRSRLPVGEWAILEILIRSHPSPLERGVITDESGYKRSTRDAYIKRLRAKELVAIEGNGLVRASDDLF